MEPARRAGRGVRGRGRVYKVDKQKAKYNGKNITMYALYTKYKNHTSGQNPFGLDMARNSKGEAMYLIPIKEGKLNEAKPYETILKQLGGNRFVAMTGAKNLGTSGKDLSFSIGRNAKRVTHVHIKLTSMDLYDVEFINMRGAKRKVIKKVRGVYGDMLPKIFKKYTGMNVRL